MVFMLSWYFYRSRFIFKIVCYSPYFLAYCYSHGARNSIQLSRILTFFFPVALRPDAGHGLLILDVSRSNTTTHHSRYDFYKRVIISSQRTLPDNTTLTTDKYPCPRWDSNPRPQQASGCRNTPQTARLLGPAQKVVR